MPPGSETPPGAPGRGLRSDGNPDSGRLRACPGSRTGAGNAVTPPGRDAARALAMELTMRLRVASRLALFAAGSAFGERLLPARGSAVVAGRRACADFRARREGRVHVRVCRSHRHVDGATTACARRPSEQGRSAPVCTSVGRNAALHVCKSARFTPSHTDRHPHDTRPEVLRRASGMETRNPIDEFPRR
jgi:hypothetical protein